MSSVSEANSKSNALNEYDILEQYITKEILPLPHSENKGLL